MNISDIEAWRAVQTTGTTQGGARLLGISQSAVSRRISQLESDLGVALFLRESARLVPTQANHRLSSHLSELLESSYRLSETAQKIGSGMDPSVPLRLAFPHSLIRHVVPRLIRGFMTLHPDARFEVFNGSYQAIQRMISNKEVDLGFLRLPDTTSGVSFSPPITAHSVCVMPTDHPLTRKEVIAITDLAGQPLVLLGRRRVPRNDIDLMFNNAGISQNVLIETHSVGSACGMVAEGLGLTIINDLMLTDMGTLPVVARRLHPNIAHHFALAHITGSLSEMGRAFETYALHEMMQAGNQRA